MGDPMANVSEGETLRFEELESVVIDFLGDDLRDRVRKDNLHPDTVKIPAHDIKRVRPGRC